MYKVDIDLKGMGGQFDPPPEKTTLKKPSLIRVNINRKFSLPACTLENSDSQKLLGVTIDRKLNFNEHVTNLCDKAIKKIQALARIFHKHKSDY